MITSYNPEKNSIHESTHSRPNMDNYYFISSREKKKNQKVGPSKQTLSSLEYSILMNHPELQSQTLTSRLFHCTPDDENSLYKKLQTKRPSKLVFRALCPNIYIQKLRIIYFLLLTQSNQLTANCQQNSTITSASAYKTNPSNQYNHETNHNSFKLALDILRAKYYSDSTVDAIKRKYLAQFFQFLEYDSDQLASRALEPQQNYPSLKSQNIVITIMNKYPIINQIFIDMLISYIKQKCLQVDKELSIDDNYNIKLFIDSMLGVQSQFTSNWEFVFGGINIVIGTDMFYLDYDRFSYFREIIESLKEKEDIDCMNGLDVSNVGGFDQQVFKKLDISYIDDLNDLLSNCSDGNSQLQTDTQIFGPSLEHQNSKILSDEKHKLGIRRVQSMSYYHPINIVGVNHKKSQLTLNMKKTQNRTLDSQNTCQLPRPKVTIHIDTHANANTNANPSKQQGMKVIKQVTEINLPASHNLLQQKKSDNPESVKNSSIPNSSTSLYETQASSKKILSEQKIQSKAPIQFRNKQTNPIQFKLASLNRVEDGKVKNMDQKNKNIYYDKLDQNIYEKKQEKLNPAKAVSPIAMISKQKTQIKRANQNQKNEPITRRDQRTNQQVSRQPVKISSINSYQTRTPYEQIKDQYKIQQTSKTQRQMQTVKSSFELPKVNSSYQLSQPYYKQQYKNVKNVIKRQSHSSNHSEESKPNLQLHSHVRIIEPVKIYTVSDNNGSNWYSQQLLKDKSISEPKPTSVRVNKQESGKQARISINLVNNQVKVLQSQKRQIVKSLSKQNFAQPISLGQSDKFQNLSLNLAKLNGQPKQQKNQPYFYSRKNSKKLFSDELYQQKSETYKQTNLPQTPQTIVKKPSILKLPPPYKRYEPSTQPTKQFDTSPILSQKTIQTPQPSQQGPERQINKQLIRDLYSAQNKGTVNKTESIDESQKGYVQIRQKIIDSGKKANSLNENDFKAVEEVKVIPPLLTQRPVSIVKNVAQNLQVPPSQDKISSLSNKANSQKSFNQVCQDINEILQNLKVTLKKNESLVTITSNMTIKTEGQQMWQRHKLKSSYDPQVLMKQQAPFQLSQQKQQRQQHTSPNNYLINTRFEHQNNNLVNMPRTSKQKYINTTQTQIGFPVPKINQVLSFKNKGIENDQKIDTLFPSRPTQRQGLINTIKGTYDMQTKANVLNPNTNNINNIKYQNSIEKNKHSLSFNVPSAVLDKYILHDKNRVNTNTNSIRSAANLTPEPIANLPNAYTPNSYINRNMYLNPVANVQYPSSSTHLSNPAIKLNLNNRQQKDNKSNGTNSQRVRQLVKNISVNSMQKQQYGSSSQFPTKEQLLRYDYRTPNASHQPINLGNNQSTSNRSNPIANINNYHGQNAAYNSNRSGNVIKSMESKIKN